MKTMLDIKDEVFRLAKFLSACRVFEVTATTATRYAALRCELKQAGTPTPVHDAWIAALCR